MSIQKNQKQSAAVKARREKHQTIPTGKSMTDQSQKDKCDVNKIMAHALKTGEIPHLRESEGRFVDVSETQSFHDAMNIVAQTNSLFAEYPAELRKDFNNDPAQFLEFINNPDNYNEMVDMGLIPAPVAPSEPSPTITPTDESVASGGAVEAGTAETNDVTP